MAGEMQRVHQRRKELLGAAEAYGLRGSVADDDAPTEQQHEREIERCAVRLVLAKLEARLLKEV